MPSVIVHLERPTPRARYAVAQVLERMLGWAVQWMDDHTSFLEARGPKLTYGTRDVPGALRVQPAGLLEGTGMHALDPEVRGHEGVPVLFPVGSGALPYDPFAAAFFQLTRYEEIVGVEKDEHGRPLAHLLHAMRHGYLRRPVVDEWALQLAKAWKRLDPTVPGPVRSYKQVVTIDLDNGFMYLGREPWRTWGSAVRDALYGRWGLVRERSRVLAGRHPDPYDIYGQLKDDILPYADRVVFFVLSAPRGAMDHAVPVDLPQYSERLRSLRKWAEVGIHPSYLSSEEPGSTQREMWRLSPVLGRPIEHSRQHFLRMELPRTYRELVELGIAEDHTMGLHDRPGFRAGTCTPYKWYDLDREQGTPLTVHPFAVMDNTLREKLHLSPEKAVEEARDLIDRVRAVDGTFTGLWHESFLSGHGVNKGWREAILRIIQAARP